MKKVYAIKCRYEDYIDSFGVDIEEKQLPGLYVSEEVAKKYLPKDVCYESLKRYYTIIELDLYDE